MRVDELTTALREEAAAQPHVDDALEEVYGRRNRRRTVLGGVAAAAMLVVVAVSIGVAGRYDDDDVVTADGVPAAIAGEWERVTDPPLSPRVNTTMVWTGDEVLVVGGDRFLCPPGAGCAGPTDPPMADGAAFDPETRTWRRIADAPAGFSFASTAVVGNDVYFLGSSQVPEASLSFLRYSVVEDRWDELPTPPGRRGWLTAVDGGVVATVPSHEGDQNLPDQTFDVETETWSDVPADPLAPSFDRAAVWVDSHLYLFAHDLVDNPGSEEPSLAQVARLDLETGIWEELPPTESLGFSWEAPIVVGTEIIRPDLGGADGGEVNGWDREYPNGGIYDTAVPEWRPLPEPPTDTVASLGAIGPDRVWSHSQGAEGLMLDVVTDTWVEVPGVFGDGFHDRSNVVGTDRSLIAVGGERWDSDGGTAEAGEIVDGAWILTFSRP